MASKSNLNAVPRDEDDEDDHPHDEGLSFRSTTDDARSLVSHGTYGQKDYTLHGISVSKRSARKAPPSEPNRKSSNLQSSSSKSLPPLRGSRQSYCGPNLGQNDSIPQLMMGLPRGDHLHPNSLQPPIKAGRRHQYQHHILRPPPGLNRAFSESHISANSSSNSVRRSHSATVSRIFDDAPEDNFHPVQFLSSAFRVPERSIPPSEPGLDIANLLGTVSIFSPTTISSLTPGEDGANKVNGTVASNLSNSDIGSVLGDSHAATSGSCRSGNPRSILNERYQKNYNRSFTKKDFVSIRDTSDGDHIPTFTSMFVCPETGECFVSGDLLTGDFVLQRDGMKWYKKKATAEFAAAGRAEDCFWFRSGECDSSGLVQQFCADSPYLVRSREEEQSEISAFLELRSCDANTRDRIKALSSERTT